MNLAKPKKPGLDYFPMDVGTFSNPTLRVFRRKYGVAAFALYTYLLCEIYRSGFYLELSDDFLFCASDDLGLEPEHIGSMLDSFCEKGVFSAELFRNERVLTSADIQQRYQEIKTMHGKGVEVERRFWLLADGETKSNVAVSGAQPAPAAENPAPLTPAAENPAQPLSPAVNPAPLTLAADPQKTLAPDTDKNMNELRNKALQALWALG